ncbi:hypothetical protein V8E36_008733 [Tilletia maclaganii]
MLLKMLHILILFSIVVLSSSITVKLRAPNETTYLHHNGTLDTKKLLRHLRYVQCRFQSTQTANHPCIFSSPLQKRVAESTELHWPAHSAAPVGELSIAGRPTLVFFDTAAQFTIFDRRTYTPALSPTAEPIGDPFLATFSDGRQSQMSRWRDFVGIGNLVAKITFDRAQEPMFNPTRTDAMGICALSRFDGLGGRPLSVIEELSRGRLLDLPVFAFALSRSGQKAPNGGWLFFGFHRRGLRFADLDRDPRYAGLWAVHGSLNGVASTMVLDTVSNLIVLPVRHASDIFARLGLRVVRHNSVLMARYNCNFHPDISIKIATRTIELSRDSVELSADEQNVCTLSIVGQQQDHITLGLPFFRNAYVAFDLVGRVEGSEGPGRIGIGPP